MDNHVKIPNDTYQKILDAVESLSKTTSYNDMTVRKICAEAGVSTGSFYHFFEGKRELIEVKVEMGNQSLADELTSDLDGYSTIEKILKFTERYGANNLKAGLEELKSLLSPTDNWYKRRQPVVNVLEDIVREGQLNGTLITTMSCGEMTDYFIDTLRGVSYNWCQQQGSFDLIERLTKHIRMLIHAFYKVI